MSLYEHPQDHALFQRIISGDLSTRGHFWSWNEKNIFTEELQKLINGLSDESDRNEQADIWVDTIYSLLCAFDRAETKFRYQNDLTPLSYLELGALEDAAKKILELRHFLPVAAGSIIKTYLGAELGSYTAELKTGRVRRAGLLSTVLSSDAKRHNARVESNLITLTSLYQQSLGAVLNLNVLQTLLEKAVSEKGVFVNPLVFSVIEHSRSRHQL